jgi:hypothetical protein
LRRKDVSCRFREPGPGGGPRSAPGEGFAQDTVRFLK